MSKLRLREMEFLAQTHTVGGRNSWDKAGFPSFCPGCPPDMWPRGLRDAGPQSDPCRHPYPLPHGPGLDASHRRSSSWTPSGTGPGLHSPAFALRRPMCKGLWEGSASSTKAGGQPGCSHGIQRASAPRPPSPKNKLPLSQPALLLWLLASESISFISTFLHSFLL